MKVNSDFEHQQLKNTLCQNGDCLIEEMESYEDSQMTYEAMSKSIKAKMASIRREPNVQKQIVKE